MRRLFADLQGELGAVIAVDGGLGNLIHEAIASRRYRVTCRTGGGHSWSHFGTPSAVHALGRIIARLSYMDVPVEPRTTFNVGVIDGGTSVNTIAAEASLLLDLRSVSAASLARLDEQAQAIWTAVGRETGVAVTAELIGDRPGGSISATHPLCQAVRAVHRELGVVTQSMPSSTDANIPLSAGVPAVTLGVTTGANGHRLDEYIQLAPVPTGLQQLLLLLHRLDAPAAIA
jgi:di/tripeptidase